MDAHVGDAIDATLSGVQESAESESIPLQNHPSTGLEEDSKTESETEDISMDGVGDPDTNSQSLSSRPLPSFRRPSRLFRKEKMHYLSSGLPSPDQKYAVSLFWPRDDDGKTIDVSEYDPGKRSQDDYPCGATLHDFFRVKLAPASDPIPSYIMTSSQLLRAMKTFGELRTAKYEIMWAELEGEPKLQNVASTQDLIEMVEGKVNRSRTEYEYYSAVRDATLVDGMDIPVTSPFHPSQYPSPWPFIPFKCGDTRVHLQERIPLYLLPQTLYVHDPFNLLCAVEKWVDNPLWTSNPDVILNYKLDLQETTLTKVETERAKAEELEELKAHTSIILRYVQTSAQMQDHEPIIEVVLPPYPRQPTKVDEGHLFFSPLGKAGTGNHSVVYNVEWELPRDLLVRPTICTPCIKESAEREIERLKTTGEWESILRAKGWGPEGYVDVVPTEGESDKKDELSDQATFQKDGEILEREIICIVSPDVPPMDVLIMIDERGVWDDFMRHREKKSAFLHLAKVNKVKSSESRTPPIIRINPSVSYHNPSLPHTLCSHDSACSIPRTAKFTVTAKLSLEGDERLEVEARNYQKFPDYFFEYWSGYILVRRLDRTVPPNAIVPQFYGYYTLEDQKTQDEENTSAPNGYLSPILLLESCGMPINTAFLSAKEQEECASLFVRFHHAGWLHESVYPRNVLVQKRRPTELPSKGTASGDRSFRLIDFGRSKEFKEVSEREVEERAMRKLFRNLPGGG